MSKYSQVITEAFEDPKIIGLTNQAIERDSKNLSLLEAIATYHIDQKRKWTGSGSEPATKKRKFDDGTITVTHNGTAGAWSDLSAANVISYPGVSFSIPQRKKLNLQIVPNVSGRGGGVRALGATGTLEFGMPWTEVEQVFCLPVPEKAKPQSNFVVIPRGGEGYAPVAAGVTVPEPMVWTELDTPELSNTKNTLRTQLKAFGKGLIEPEQAEFFSAIPQSHRKGEKAYHVKAFKGSKDGFLYLLSSGIIFAFKKPIQFFPFHCISSISYTSVLQRTFNLVITTQPPEGQDEGQETEFSMLDQADFAGIDEYIKRHGLNDASLAQSRKAQRFGVNDPKDKNKQANGTAALVAVAAENGDEEESELQKAERMLQDEEDEDEEDYNPEDEEEDSDGSGSDSDEDDDEDDENEEDEDEDGEGEEEGGEEEGEEEEEEEEEEVEEVVKAKVRVRRDPEHLPDEPEEGFI